MITKKALREYLTNGGATLTASGTVASFSRGYQVAGVAAVDVLPVADINGAFEAVKKLLKSCNAGELVGLRVDGGRVYIGEIRIRKKTFGSYAKRN